MSIEFEEWFEKNAVVLYEEYLKHPNCNILLNIETVKDLLEKAYNHYETT